MFPSHPSLLVSWLLHAWPSIFILIMTIRFSPGRLAELWPGTVYFQDTVRQWWTFQCDSHQAWSHHRRGSGLLGLNNSFNYVFPWLPASSLKDEQSFISGSKGQLQFIPEGLRRCPEGETILNWHIRVASVVFVSYVLVIRLISCMMVRLSWVVHGGSWQGFTLTWLSLSFQLYPAFSLLTSKLHIFKEIHGLLEQFLEIDSPFYM